MVYIGSNDGSLQWQGCAIYSSLLSGPWQRNMGFRLRFLDFANYSILGSQPISRKIPLSSRCFLAGATLASANVTYNARPRINYLAPLSQLRRCSYPSRPRTYMPLYTKNGRDGSSFLPSVLNSATPTPHHLPVSTILRLTEALTGPLFHPDTGVVGNEHYRWLGFRIHSLAIACVSLDALQSTPLAQLNIIRVECIDGNLLGRLGALLWLDKYLRLPQKRDCPPLESPPLLIAATRSTG
ncbi:hypothetical protein FB45DRAFT_1017787 [Roridomyces roridus]|uniref:Uncharacterized protein n=1 Tax=Roridomyces roridus TaxID=1738132 RepID=A0AAD7G161_9AGAR|nr:hypothetical protein FB45DRAFT_1017787 [Roridomyces roridus]